MTNALALARAVYPHNDVQTYENMKGETCWKWKQNPEHEHYTVWSFDPRNNPAQFVDVLAWLLRQEENNTIESNVVLYAVEDRTGWGKKHGAGWVKKRAEDHDGTALSLVSAVVAAAERVAEDIFNTSAMSCSEKVENRTRHPGVDAQSHFDILDASVDAHPVGRPR